MRPYIPENRSSSPCATGSCSGSGPLSAVPEAWKVFAVPHILFPADTAFRNSHPSQDLRSASYPSCHPSAGCYLPAFIYTNN